MTTSPGPAPRPAPKLPRQGDTPTISVVVASNRDRSLLDAQGRTAEQLAIEGKRDFIIKTFAELSPEAQRKRIEQAKERQAKAAAAKRSPG